MKTKTKKPQPKLKVKSKKLAPGWRHGNTSLVLLVVVIVAIVAGGVGWMLARNHTQSNPQMPTVIPPITQPQSVDSVSVQQDETATWQTYTNARYGYQLKLPSDFGKPSSPYDSGNPATFSKCLSQTDNCIAQAYIEIQDMENFEIPDNNLDQAYGVLLGDASLYKKLDKNSSTFLGFPSLSYVNIGKNGSYEKGLIIEKGNKYFKVSASVSNGKESDISQIEGLFLKVLPAFIFLN